MIKSRQNRLLKDMRRAQRSKGDLCLIEGPRLIREAMDTGIQFHGVAATEVFLAGDEGSQLAALLEEPPTPVLPGLLNELADADSPRGVVALAHMPRGGTEQIPTTVGSYLYLDGVQDPGNVGALARVAEAVGDTALVLGLGCAHPNHPRAIRASAGSLLRVACARLVTTDALRDVLEHRQPTWVGLIPRGGESIFGPGRALPLVLAVGAEGQGLSADTLSQCAVRATIPLAEPVESLNAAVAGALALYALRQGAATAAESPG